MSIPADGPTTAIRSPLLRVTSGPAKGDSLVAALLREQQTMTAVERFSRKHDECTIPAQAKFYRDLVPLERPRPGQQYAFEVDLDACTGCKACVAACHSLNGLEEAEVWRTVGLLHGGTAEAPAQQTVTTSCHHCVDPGCMSGCPVQAYEKDPVTGVVRHLDDQCIGCQYCTLMCPYDAPKYSKRLGIVRKCDMCSDRLAVGEAPACVQGCPNQAIRIKVVEQHQAVQASAAGAFLPGAPAPDHTVPTTVYKSAKAAPPNLLPADFYSVSPEHGHMPLVLLLVFTQLAAGAFAGTFLAKLLLPLPVGGPWALAHAGFALALGLGALGASFLHLGRPLGAWRAFLGLRTSWMSREAVSFALFAKVGVVYALSLAADRLPDLPGKGLLVALRSPLEGGAAGIGLVGVYCSAMLYAATRRHHWRASLTGTKFFATTVLLGSATVLAVSEVARRLLPAEAGTVTATLGRVLLLVILGAATIKLALEASVVRHLRAKEHTIMKRVAIVMLRDLRPATGWRFICGVAGGVLMPGIALLRGTVEPALAVAILLSLLAGELFERYLFFKAAPSSRMPGGLN